MEEIKEKEFMVVLKVKVRGYASIKDLEREIEMFNSANKGLIEVEVEEIKETWDLKGMIDGFADRISSYHNSLYQEPLDCDETDRIGKLLTLELDKRQGNLENDEEYYERLLEIEYN
jgi:hypothetical protein